MFAERLRAVGGVPYLVRPPDLLDTVAGLIDAHRPVLLTPETAWLASELDEWGIEAVITSAAPAELEPALRRCGAGVTGCVAAAASTGTVLVGPEGGGGGLASSLPERHVVLVRESDIHATLGEVLSVLAERFGELDGEAVLITGPSRTADIEMMSVVGVHGPLSLDVVIILAEGA
ncbi:MAG: lactate utilization protein [Actinobacteria bacterium]|nr:lactate utilization protein [Actinomycetota bacterium]